MKALDFNWLIFFFQQISEQVFKLLIDFICYIGGFLRKNSIFKEPNQNTQYWMQNAYGENLQLFIYC